MVFPLSSWLVGLYGDCQAEECVRKVVFVLLVGYNARYSQEKALGLFGTRVLEEFIIPTSTRGETAFFRILHLFIRPGAAGGHAGEDLYLSYLSVLGEKERKLALDTRILVGWLYLGCFQRREYTAFLL